MNLVRPIIWIGFVSCVLFFILQHIEYRTLTSTAFSILPMEFLSKERLGPFLRDMMEQPLYWEYAKSNTIVDFFFIIFYCAVIILISYKLMQLQSNPVLNNLIRFNILLAIIVGILDWIENIFILLTLHFFPLNNFIISPRWLAIPKFTLAGYIILTWLLVCIIRLFRKEQARTA